MGERASLPIAEGCIAAGSHQRLSSKGSASNNSTRKFNVDGYLNPKPTLHLCSATPKEAYISLSAKASLASRLLAGRFWRRWRLLAVAAVAAPGGPGESLESGGESGRRAGARESKFHRRCRETNGIPFWLVGEFTTHFRTYFGGWIGMFTGGTGC